MVERVISQRSKRSFWFNRGLAIFLLVVVVAFVLGNRFYNTIQKPFWSEIAKAEAEAVEKLNIRDITEVERFIGDEAYTIIFATNPVGEKVIVWVWDDGLHVERASAGISKEEARRLCLSGSPGNSILRVTPGKLREQYVWEVFYTKREDGSERYYYDYFRFSDGVKLDTYRLAKHS